VALSSILALALMLVLPQLAGLLVVRVVGRTTWVAWPAAAIAVYGVAFYFCVWVPTRHYPCGTGREAFGIILLAGLLLHLGTGTLLGLLARRLRRSVRP